MQGKPDYALISTKVSPARYSFTVFQKNSAIVERVSTATEPASLTYDHFPVKVRSWGKIYHL